MTEKHKPKFLQIEIGEDKDSIPQYANAQLLVITYAGGKPKGNLVPVKRFIEDLEAAIKQRLDAMDQDFNTNLAPIMEAAQDSEKPIFVITDDASKLGQSQG